MKTIYTFLFAVLAFANQSIIAQTPHQEAQKDLLRNIQIEDQCQPIIFMLFDDVKVEEWEKNYIKVETNIHALNFSENLLDYLVASGRYDIDVRTREDGTRVISMPKRDLVIMKKNADMEEFLTIHVYVPKGLFWELLDPRLSL